MRRLSIVLFFACGFAFAYVVSGRGRARDAYARVCSLTALHFYKDTPALRSWIARCHRSATELPPRISHADLLTRLQTQMDELSTSHFSVYAPAEDTKLWTGRDVHTGIRARYVEGHLLVYAVHDGSAAQAAGVRPGDEITRLPGVDEVSPYGAAHRAGAFGIRRGGRDSTVTIEPGPVQVSGAPRITDLDRGISVLTIPSFRAEYFHPDELRAMARRLAPRHGVIVDLRENAGGNFAAMLRTLSFFTCTERTIGQLVQPRKSFGTGRLIDSLEDSRQIGQLDHFKDLDLTTSALYGCFKGDVVTLVTSETASVAEIFADAMVDRPRSRVWGWPTAGDVVLAIWYDLPSLGPGYSVSIPQASYVNRRGRELEGAGVRPSRELFYDLPRGRRGEDAWISEAAASIR